MYVFAPGGNSFVLSNIVNVMRQKYRQGINFPILPLYKANPRYICHKLMIRYGYC